MVRRIVVVALIAGVGLVSAAGTGVAGTSAKKKPLTKAQFIAQANALCEAAGADLQRVIQSFGKGNGSPTKQQAASLVAQAAPIVQKQIDATKKLVPPARDRAKIKKYLKAAADGLKKVEADPSIVGKKGANPLAAADKLARAYGLEGGPGAGACGSGGGGGGGATSTTGSSPGTGGGGGGAPASAGSPAS